MMSDKDIRRLAEKAKLLRDQLREVAGFDAPGTADYFVTDFVQTAIRQAHASDVVALGD